jgi:hypothetical protein
MREWQQGTIKPFQSRHVERIARVPDHRSVSEMPLNRTSPLQKLTTYTALYQNLAFVLCILFGIVLVANIQTAADGGWFWYATFLHNGHRLYSGMHLALQPLFVLETLWFLTLLGKGWIVSKVPAVLHLIAYCLGLLLLVRRSSLSDRHKALLLVSVFFLSITFEGYRFDDYHVLADCFQVYSLVLLLRLQPDTGLSHTLRLVAALGVLSGLAIMNRLNDGAALVVGVTISILCLAPSKKLASLALFAAVAAFTVVIVVSLTGDSLHDYATYSIFRAAGIKGGAGNILTHPIHLPYNALQFLKPRWHQKWAIYTIAAALAWGFLVAPARWKKGRREIWKLMLGLFLILLPLPFIYRGFFDTHLIEWLSAVATLAAYVLGAFIVFRFIRWQINPKQRRWNPLEILLIIPLGQLASGSMSSGGEHIGLYGPLAILILLLPVASPISIKSERWRGVIFAVAAILLSNCVLYKISIPFSWHSYRLKPMFIGRQWYRHPDYGPMIIETQHLTLLEKVCDQIASGNAPRELLSMPYSNANYFCSIPPWHDYVQTFFDTSSADTIFGLVAQLQTAPPQWILYQRQMDSMALHETLYNQGHPLPHRYLDQIIEQKLATGEWQTVFTSNYGDHPGWSDEWIFIHTQPDRIASHQ